VAAAVAAADHGDRPSGPVFTTAGYPTASRPPTPGRSAQPGCAGQPKKIPGFGKDCSGLDQAQARLYHAIARHTVLVMAALAICAVTAALLRRRTDTAAPAPVLPDQPPPAEFGMIPLTVPETGRLLSRPPPPCSAAHWLDWRRRHQARSRWYHQRTRLARDAAIVLVS
jgi:hypothetical protein